MKPLRTVTVREQARLSTEAVAPTLDEAQLPPAAFDWLCRLAGSWRRGGATLLQVEDRRWLRLEGQVGVIETPCGTRLEILPKTTDAADEAAVREARALLRRLLATALDLPAREAGEAALQDFGQPLDEWAMGRFLAALRQLLQRGLRQDYARIEEPQRFLRGQLDLARQLHEPPGRDPIFHLRHDVFGPDRPENRLLQSALRRVCARVRSPQHWRLAHELAARLDALPESRDIARDFRAWGRDRLTAHYEPARPWCELVLGRHLPQALAGEARARSLLFPMERLFERGVAAALRRELPPGSRLTEQSARHALCEHQGRDFLKLRPDLLIEGCGARPVVVDAKWKRLDAGARDANYGIEARDLHQLFAYGQKYLQGRGELALVYPKTARFREPLPPFRFGTGLDLWVLPFDLTHPEAPFPAATPWKPQPPQ